MTQVLMTYSTGQYSITATDAYNCITEDTGFVSFVTADILNNDTILCLGDSLQIHAFNDTFIALHGAMDQPLILVYYLQ